MLAIGPNIAFPVSEATAAQVVVCAITKEWRLWGGYNRIAAPFRWPSITSEGGGDLSVAIALSVSPPCPPWISQRIYLY